MKNCVVLVPFGFAKVCEYSVRADTISLAPTSKPVAGSTGNGDSTGCATAEEVGPGVGEGVGWGGAEVAEGVGWGGAEVADTGA